jgi:hypothetical protein
LGDAIEQKKKRTTVYDLFSVSSKGDQLLPMGPKIYRRFQLHLLNKMDPNSEKSLFKKGMEYGRCPR